MIRTCLAAAFDSSNSHDNWLGSLANELNSFVSLGTDRNTLLSLLTCSLPFFVWLYLLSVSALFATALLSLGTRLGSPPRQKLWGESFYLRALLCFAKLRALLLKDRPASKFRGILITCVLCFVICVYCLLGFA